MSAFQLKVGSIEMGAATDNRTKFSAPESIEDGVEVHLGIHKFIDESGKPIIRTHSMGAFPLPQSWKGELYGSTALTNHTALKILAARQREIQITVGPFSWQGVISKYSGIINHENCITYTIDILITQDNNGTKVISAANADFDIGTQSFVDSSRKSMTAIASNPRTTVPKSIINSHDDLLQKITAAQPIKNASVSKIQQLQSDVSKFVNQAQAYTQPLFGTKLSTQIGSDLNLMNQVVSNYSLLNQNLGTLTGTGTSQRQIQLTAGANMMQIAAKYFPTLDPVTTAVRIAQANNLNGLFSTAPMSLKLPPVFHNDG